MPRYSYKAKNLEGKMETGVVEASDQKELAATLKKKGQFLLSVDDGAAGKKKDGILKRIGAFDLMVGVPMAEKLFFTRNMGIMIKTGVPLPKAFQILSKQTKSKKFQKALSTVSERIIKGDNLSKSLGLYPKIFPRIYRETLKVGEETGKLEDAFRTLSDQMDREHKLKSSIKTAMLYPSVVLCMAVVIGIVMIVVAVPKLQEAFLEMDMELPVTTRAVLGFADFLTGHPILTFLVFAIFSLGLVLLLKSGKGGRTKSFLALKIPVISKISKKTNSALSLRMLSSLLTAGVPIVRALDIVAGALSNHYFRDSLMAAAKMVEKGKKLSFALKPYENLYTQMVLQMMEVGEETGETPSVLSKLAGFYEEEVAAATQKLSSIIEPFLILIIGGAVGFFAISMMQPMFSMMGQIN